MKGFFSWLFGKKSKKEKASKKRRKSLEEQPAPKAVDVSKKRSTISASPSDAFPTPSTYNSEYIWNVLKQDDNFILTTLIRMTGIDPPGMWDAARDLLTNEGILLDIMKKELKLQINSTLNKAQLFRTNNGLSYLFASVMKRELHNVLVEYVNPILKSINELDDVLEVDPAKVNEDIAEKNSQILLQLLKDHVFNFDIIINNFSPMMNHLLRYIKDEVVKKFPDNGMIAVGGFLFLRFINPAIVTPQRFGDICLFFIL